uniref:RING-type E3 ubiquitin transferase n=2 Tax=Brassica oleracea var. oleracea TaxID=109376 RepID=A0A0D3AW65_BRAOL
MVSETPSKATNRSVDGSSAEIFISPRFKSAAALAGWDEEDLIIASFVVEDTPERSSSKRRRRSNLLSKTSPPSSGSRRRQRIKQSSNPLPVIDLDEVIRREEEKSAEKKKRKNKETKPETKEEKKAEEDEKILPEEKNTTSVVLPCIDKLRDELSCAICLEICFEPSTTTCGHSFCKKCLRSAADKCGRKCPKCRQLIGNGKYCTVNTVLWNTIQLLFPKEVEAQRASASANFLSKETPTPRDSNHRLRSRNRETALQARLQREDISRLLVSEERSERRRRGGSVRLDQDSDAAFALRLQRQEFASAFGVTAAGATSSSSSSSSSSSDVSLSRARANLRAMASRAARRQ